MSINWVNSVHTDKNIAQAQADRYNAERKNGNDWYVSADEYDGRSEQDGGDNVYPADSKPAEFTFGRKK